MIAELVRSALRNLRAHPLRFAMTSLGILWGAAVLTYLSANVTGFYRDFDEKMSVVGPRVVFLFAGWILDEKVGERSGRPVELELEDVERLRSFQILEGASPRLELGPRILRAERRTKLVRTQGINEDAGTIRNFVPAAGRFLTRQDIERRARVVYLGGRAAERLFGQRDPVGRTLTVDSISFRVVGVGVRKGRQLVNMGAQDDEVALIPVTTAQRWFTQNDRIGGLILAAHERGRARLVIELTRGLLGVHHNFGPDAETALGGFALEDALQLINALGMALRLFFTATSLVTLAVGAVGVMNIMLVVVNERRREIGLRKAVGASTQAIFGEFLVETLVITMLSGAAGIALGWLAVASTGRPSEDALAAFVPQLDPTTVVTIFLVLVAVGLAAGLLPALRASRIEPATALRSL